MNGTTLEAAQIRTNFACSSVDKTASTCALN